MSTARGVRFDRICMAMGLPRPVPEYKFALASHRREWRFDWAWPDRFVALEVEGGVWSIGRHQRPGGFREDIRKYNAAALNGWRVFRVEPDHLAHAETIEMLKRALR